MQSAIVIHGLAVTSRLTRVIVIHHLAIAAILTVKVMVGMFTKDVEEEALLKQLTHRLKKVQNLRAVCD